CYFRQIALGLLNCENRDGRFPPHAIYDQNGRPLLSWRVTILPGIEHTHLFKAFHLDEPWDSEHNKNFIQKMPEIYRHPELETPGMTCYQAVVGKDCAFEGSEGIKLSSFLDGVAKTILLVETTIAAAVPWTRPDDWMFDETDPFKGLDSEAFNVAFADCRGESIERSIDPEVFKSLILRNDGKPTPYDHRTPLSLAALQ